MDYPVLSLIWAANQAYTSSAASMHSVADIPPGTDRADLPPLAWGHRWFWTVPLLVVLLDKATSMTGHAHWAWTTSTAAVYLIVFMWFSA
ncbi:MAG: hypothetical protein K2Q25_07640 [Mycobacteriaceae bacterium]|nr:hypothetical protein [Mycobacteriaceae bacterium]